MIAITIDCEEWNSPLMRGKKVPENNNTEYSRLGNEKLLKLFKKYNVKATFFVTGFFAKKEKAQVKRILKAGHELASHGNIHHYRHNETLDLLKDVSESKKVLERITGKKILGFRAPQGRYSEELMRILEKKGFKYDSSMHPAHIPGWYNNSKYPLEIHKPFKKLKIQEIPIAAMPLTRWPVVWLAMRLLGNIWSAAGCRMLLNKGITPNIYFHSWEFHKIKSKHVPWYLTYRTGDAFLKELESFIRTFRKERFVRLIDLL